MYTYTHREKRKTIEKMEPGVVNDGNEGGGYNYIY